MQSRGLRLLLFGCALALANASLAQDVGPLIPEGVRPSERELPAPEFVPEAKPRQVLPPWKPTLRDSRGSDPTLRIERITFEGNSALTDAELTTVATPWLRRPLDSAEVRALRDALTLAYVQRGYRTSGARLLPLEANGTLRVRIVEGKLARVVVEGTRWVRPGYIARRLERGADAPLDVGQIEHRIRRLQQDPRLESIHADLRPGAQLGESVLDVQVVERTPIQLQADFDNRLSPSLGEARGQVTLTHRSLLGFGDTLSVAIDRTEGGGSIEGRYALPLNAYDTRIELQGRYSDNDLVLGLGEELRIESDYWALDVSLHQPFEIHEGLELGFGVTGSLRESEIQFLGGLNFPVPGAPEGPARVAAVRVVADALWRGTDHVLAIRSTGSFGIDAFRATRNAGTTPESRFASWLTQAQWVQRFRPLGVEFVVRGDLQLATDPLLTVEQFSLGGRNSVRGYRENQLVRDQGAVGSVELRIPVWRDAVDGRALVQLAPFFDIGRIWNVQSASESAEAPDTLASAGLGLRIHPTRQIRGEVYWGARLYDADVEEESLQDDGIHFRLTVSWP